MKYYVVWKGHHPGVYDDWNDALEQITGYPGAVYKSFSSSTEAAEAFRKGCGSDDSRQLGALLDAAARKNSERSARNSTRNHPDPLLIPEIDPYGWAVDAACSGNPGIMEYRGVEIMTGKELFHIGPLDDATNNIGEFLAIVHAMALMFQRGEKHTIYSDSVSGMAWVRNRKVKTQLTPTPRNARTFDLLRRAIAWLNTHQGLHYRIMKWDTREWGEIPADFGRKSSSKYGNHK